MEQVVRTKLDIYFYIHHLDFLIGSVLLIILVFGAVFSVWFVFLLCIVPNIDLKRPFLISPSVLSNFYSCKTLK
jgi:hypothetical protein